MTPGRIRFLLFEFMADIYPGKVSDLDKYGDIFNELGDKLSQVLYKESEVDEYLNNILEYIDGLNKFFAKQKGKSRIPYSKLMTFANKDERISEFLLDEGLKKKLSKNSEIELAGFDDKAEEKSSDIIYDNEIYGHIYSIKNRGVFFSPAVNKVIIQYSNGKIISYSLYRKKARKGNKKYLKLSKVYKELLCEENCGGTVEAFKGYRKHLFLKNKAKKNGKRKSKKTGL